MYNVIELSVDPWDHAHGKCISKKHIVVMGYKCNFIWELSYGEINQGLNNMRDGKIYIYITVFVMF